MRRLIVGSSGLLAALVMLAGMAGQSSAGIFPKGTHECQHPIMTGVEVFGLKHVSVATACPVALKLFAYESKGNELKIYGCHRPNRNSAGYPYLRAKSFDGWALSLTKSGAFTMSQGASSFGVEGTDFPLNCS